LTLDHQTTPVPLDADHRSRPTADLVGPEDAVYDAAAYCPMEAITVVDEASGRVVYPDDGIG